VNSRAPKKSEQRTWRSVLELAFEYLNEYKLFIAAMAGVASFYLTPLKDLIYHQIWSENAIVTITTESNDVRVQDELKIYMTLLPNSPIGLSEGIATISFSNNKLRLLNQSSTFRTPKTLSPVVLLDGNPVVLVAAEPGDATLSVEVKTRHGTFQGTRDIRVLDSASPDIGRIAMRPSARNFSGEWRLRVGHLDGKMNILDRGGNITGHYSLDDGMQGVISGIRDGGVFSATFYRTSTELKWGVTATHKVSDGFILVEGKAQLHKIGQAKWIAIGNADPFLATVQLLP
jgi:hypothetical protein